MRGRRIAMRGRRIAIGKSLSDDTLSLPEMN